MHAYARWKFWLILTVLIGSIMGAAPNVMTSLPSWWPASMSQPMNLGLDLKGGIHLVVDVDIEQVVKQQVSDNINVIRRALREENIRYSKLESNATQVTVVIKEVADINQAEKVLKAALNGFTMEAV